MRTILIFLFVLIGTFLIDQGIKEWAVNTAQQKVSNTMTTAPMDEEALIGTTLAKSKCINLELQINKGVAFSMFAFLGEYMKWIQGSLVLILIFILFKENYLNRYAFPAGLLIGGALGNVYDRFIHTGVIDYIAWHCGFRFAIFNYADMMINLAFIIIIIMVYFFPEKSKNT